jgi:hypothetical protein
MLSPVTAAVLMSQCMSLHAMQAGKALLVDAQS